MSAESVDAVSYGPELAWSRKVATAVVEDRGSGCTMVAPVPGSVHPWDGEIVTKRLRSPEQSGCSGWSFFVASYADAYLWDCKPAYETASGWGH